MRPEDFRAEAAGKVIRTPARYFAFIPAPLPPKLEYDGELVRLLSRADAALGELSGVGRHLPDPHVLISPYVRREAVLSSRIEGTTTELSELLLDDIAKGAGTQDPDDVREVRNYVTALEYGVRRLETLPLSLRLVRELHERLMRGVRGDYATPGEFRRSQNWIGAPGSTIEAATYVPPPPDTLMETLGAWERFLHDQESVPDLVQCALMHEQFEAIHPFLDGNGRVGRLLITLFLVERQRLSQPLLYLSAWFERYRDDYLDGLQRVRTRGDWRGWLAFFLRGVTEIAAAASRQAATLMDLREGLRKRLHDRPRAILLVDPLLTNPFMTVARAEKIMKVSNPTARQLIGQLEKRKILEEVTGRGWGRVYLARQVLDAIEDRDTKSRPNARSRSKRRTAGEPSARLRYDGAT
ncbi:MAG: Fic family protein [Candidatus Rokubacteria bacterium]|nr:Fic family protein [Candidatus Rokubacteria bacterium]MBI3827093.1 Fic family protein [Candidatus Rokubacteria bacterium]